MKFWHEEGDIRLELDGRGVRVDVEVGSKPVEAGVRRALRFCVMLSSIEERDRRRKSMKRLAYMLLLIRGI